MADPPTETAPETVQPEGQPQEPDPVQGEEEGKIEFGDPDDEDEVSMNANGTSHTGLCVTVYLALYEAGLSSLYICVSCE